MKTNGASKSWPEKRNKTMGLSQKVRQRGIHMWGQFPDLVAACADYPSHSILCVAFSP